jgi:hypothetical protein
MVRMIGSAGPSLRSGRQGGVEGDGGVLMALTIQGGITSRRVTGLTNRRPLGAVRADARASVVLECRSTMLSAFRLEE